MVPGPVTCDRGVVVDVLTNRLVLRELLRAGGELDENVVAAYVGGEGERRYESEALHLDVCSKLGGIF
jgi:CheY-like chemotaxis protein